MISVSVCLYLSFWELVLVVSEGTSMLDGLQAAGSFLDLDAQVVWIRAAIGPALRWSVSDSGEN